MGNYTELIDKEEYHLALKDIDLDLEGDQYNIELLTVKAKVLTKLEQHTEAIDLYSKVINLVPSQAENYADRGLCYNFISLHNESLADFSKAVDLEPENPYRYASRAFIKDAQGDSIGALDDYEIAIQLDPEDAISLNNKGLIEDKLGRANEASKSFNLSDKASGIKLDTGEFNLKKEVSKKASKPKMKIRYYYSILKGLLNSAAERRKFYKFITNK